jgi:starvation-inducible DNA-binding protein
LITETRIKASSAHGISTYPAPRQLATPTDLVAEDVGPIVEAINPIIADAFALHTKMKNFHWYLSGSHFRDYHLLLDEQAEEIFGAIDPLAERLRKIGGTTLRSITHISSLQTIDDDDEFVEAGDMMRRLMADNEHIAKAQRAAIETCEDHHDSVTANLLQEVLDATEGRIFMSQRSSLFARALLASSSLPTP